MIGWKVGCVQERRSHVGHVGMQVLRFDPEDEAVRVGEAESKIVAVMRQQLFVIRTIHNEFAEFEYGEADCEWTIHHYARARRLHENQVEIYDRAALEGGFARGRDEFLRIAHESRVDALSQIDSHVFPKKLFGSSLYNGDSNSVLAFWRCSLQYSTNGRMTER